MDAIALTQKLVSFDTVNPPGNEAACAQYVSGLLQKSGFRVQAHEFESGRPSLVAHKPGAQDLNPICLCGHLDTVPLGQRPWQYDPFGGQVIEGRLYGRGAADMKAGVAAMLTAVARLDHNPCHDRGVLLILTAGEEKWCQGAYHLAGLPQGSLPPAELLVIGEPSQNQPLIGHKGALWIEIATTGRSAHGSMPEEGENAIYKAAEIIRRLQAMVFDHPSHPWLGSATLNVGTIQGGQNTNSIPDAATLTVDIRTLPGQTGQVVVDQLMRIVADLGTLRVLTDVSGVATEGDHPWVVRIVEIVAGIRGQQTTVSGAPYFTDAAALVPALGNPPMVILGPGKPQMAHQTDEYCDVAAIEACVEIYLQILRQNPKDII